MHPTGSTKQPRLLSIDFGRTATKACVSRQTGEVVLIPSQVARLPVEKVRASGFEDDDDGGLVDIWLEYQGQGYAFGQLAEDYGADLGLGQSKLHNALHKTLACIGYFGLSGSIALVVDLPFAEQEQFERERGELTAMLVGNHHLQYRGKPIEIEVSQVWVMPEGYGSLIWTEAQATDAPESGLLTQRSAAIVDIGHQSTDLLMTDNFRFARGASSSLRYGMATFYENLAAQIEGAESQSLSLIEAVHKPEGQRLYRPRGGKRPVHLDELLSATTAGFAQSLSAKLIEWLPERATDIVVTGGGGEFIWSALEPLVQELGLRAHLAKPSRTANALGQYVYGQLRVVESKSA